MLRLAELWGVPPWVIEREASIYWVEAAADYEREKERLMRKAQRQYGRR